MGAGGSPGDWSALETRVRSHLKRGEHDAAARAAIERLNPAVLPYLCTRLAEADAEEALSIFQESVWKDLPRFRWECSLRAWGYRLAHHASNRILRRPHRRREGRLPSSAASRLPASMRVASGRHEGLALLRASLPSDEQELLTLRVDRELEWEEIAAVLDGNAPALRKRYERLTRKLEQMAREQGLID